MNILEIADQLRKLVEERARETGKSSQEVWDEAVKELDNMFKNEENKYQQRKQNIKLKTKIFMQ